MVNFYVWPEVRAESQTLEYGDRGYRDALCSFIRQRVVGAEVYLDDGFVLEFPAGELAVSPEQIRSAPGPEVVQGDDWILQSDEVPFD